MHNLIFSAWNTADITACIFYCLNIQDLYSAKYFNKQSTNYFKVSNQ